MKLHTRAQAPREGGVETPAKPAEPYVTTHMDYLRFLVDSRHVYAAMEEIVDSTPELASYRNTGLERVKGLDIDIAWMASEYNLEIPEVGSAGLTYAKNLHEVVKKSIPAYMCKLVQYFFDDINSVRAVCKLCYSFAACVRYVCLITTYI